MAIDARTRAILDKYYSHAIERVTSDEDELLIAEDMLRRARSGAVPDETGTKTMVIDPRRKVPLDNPLLVRSAANALRQENLKRVLPIAGLVAALVMVVFLMDRGGGEEEAVAAVASGTPAGTGVITGTVTLTTTPTLCPELAEGPTATPTLAPTATFAPTPTTLPTATPTAPPPGEPTPEVVQRKRTPVSVKPSGMTIWPVSVEIKERIFPVAITGLSEKDDHLWGYAPEDNRVSWLAGSWVNVVLGLPFSFGNLDLLESLEINDPLIIRDNHAVIHRFKVADVRVVKQHQIETLRQKEAGLTLVLLNKDVGEREGDRLVAKARPERLVGESGEFSTRPTATATPLPTSTAWPTSPPVSASTGWITYTVRGGDTLTGIASTFSSTAASTALLRYAECALRFSGSGSVMFR